MRLKKEIKLSDVNGINNNENSIKKLFGNDSFPQITPKELPNNNAAVIKKGEETKENEFPFDLKDIVYPSKQEDFNLETYVLPKFKTKISMDDSQAAPLNNAVKYNHKENTNFKDAVQNWNKIRTKAEKILNSTYTEDKKPYLKKKPAK